MLPRSSCMVGQVANLPKTRQIRNLPHFIVLGFIVFAAVVASDRPVKAQPAGRAGFIAGNGGSRTVPTAAYHAAFADFYDGDYRTALDEFRSAARGAIKTVNARWIDSICYETMIGECDYQTGGNAEAFEHYSAALNLFLANSKWFSSVSPKQISAANNPRAPPALAGPQPARAVGTPGYDDVNPDGELRT